MLPTRRALAVGPRMTPHAPARVPALPAGARTSEQKQTNTDATLRLRWPCPKKQTQRRGILPPRAFPVGLALDPLFTTTPAYVRCAPAGRNNKLAIASLGRNFFFSRRELSLRARGRLAPKRTSRSHGRQRKALRRLGTAWRGSRSHQGQIMKLE